MMKSAISHAICLLVVLGFMPPLYGREQLQFDRQTPVVKVYERTHKAVVNISGEQTVSRRAWPGFDQFDLWGPRFERQVPVLGSGFVVHENGFIITNAHVVEGVKRIKVVFSDGREFQAEIISVDADKDLALLAIKAGAELPFIELGRSNDLMIGETVIAIGNPYGYANTVISAVGRDIRVTEDYWLRGLIQTDAPINPGNSGGPLLNVNGQLIGITTAIRAEAQNIGFAIPVDTLVDNLTHMLMPEKLRRVRLGLTMGPMQSQGQHTGLIVTDVDSRGIAGQTGIQPGDLLLQLNDATVRNLEEFSLEMEKVTEGDTVEFRILRISIGLFGQIERRFLVRLPARVQKPSGPPL